MTYKGKPLTIRRVANKLRKEIKKNPQLKRTIEAILYRISAVRGFFLFRPSLRKILSPEEIQQLIDYKKSQAEASPKTAAKFQKDILSLSKGGLLTIEALDVKLPNILTKLTNDPIEKSAILLRGTDAHTTADLKDYCDRRILPRIDKRSAAFKSRDRTFSPQLALEAFMDIKEILDTANIPFFLAGGTLLGAIRDGGFIPNDYNIDLGFFAHDVDMDTLEAIIKRPEVFIRFEIEIPYHIELRHTNGVWIHLHNHFLDGQAICHRSPIHQWYNTPFGLKKIRFVGTEVNVPANADLYLSENYGNWRDHICFFDFSYDTPNVRYAQTIESLEYFTERISSAVKNKWLLSYACSNRGLSQAFDLDFSQYYPAPADGDIIDNPNPRKQLLVLQNNSLDHPEILIKKLIKHTEGTNIVLDIVAIAAELRQIDWLESFAFVDTVLAASTCESLDPEMLARYDTLVRVDNMKCEVFEAYPTTHL